MNINDIRIRTQLQPGDIGYVVHMHGRIYQDEYGYSILFETYVAEGLCEFYRRYDPLKDRVWICEHEDRIVGSLLLMHREDDMAQLRYFILESAYRGIGLGRRLMALFIDHLKQTGYRGAYLWTTDELDAAAALYKRYGFVLTGSKESAAFGKAVKEMKYELRL